MGSLVSSTSRHDPSKFPLCLTLSRSYASPMVLTPIVYYVTEVPGSLPVCFIYSDDLSLYKPSLTLA